MEPVGSRPGFLTALAFWFKLGWISFGGPAGQIALLHQEVVQQRAWIDERRFLHALNFCMLLPGPEAQQLATYIGWILHRTWGGVAAGVLFVLPSLLILIGLSWLYASHGQQPQVAAVLWALKPAVVAVVVAAAQRIGARVLHHRLLWSIATGSFLGLSVLGLPFPLVIAVAAFVGWWARDRVPQAFAQGAAGGHGPAASESSGEEPLEPGDPAADAGSRRAAALAALVCVLLWALTLGALALTFGTQAPFTQMGWFFTQAAMVTFGGAYAVLPFVMDGAVHHYGWLTAAQMIDGLALGETTPGPLIMVVAFVGFLGGWGAEVFGPGRAFWSGAAAAVVVTWFTFLPSFFFILAGAPLVERTRGLKAWSAPLTAVTAAVVGVVLNLALVLAMQVLWPQGLEEAWREAAHGAAADARTMALLVSHMDGAALVTALVCWGVLRSGRLGVVPVLLLAGLTGALMGWVRGVV